MAAIVLPAASSCRRSARGIPTVFATTAPAARRMRRRRARACFLVAAGAAGAAGVSVAVGVVAAAAVAIAGEDAWFALAPATDTPARASTAATPADAMVVVNLMPTTSHP